MLCIVSTPQRDHSHPFLSSRMSFDALSQIEKHEAAELLYLKKAKEQRKAANSLRKTLNIKQEAEVAVAEESAVPDVVVALPLASAAAVTLPESPLPSPAQMPRDFKELPMQPQAPGAPVKKARKPMTAEHKAKFQAGRQAWLEKKHAAAAAKQEPLVAKELDFSDVAAAIGVPAAEKLWASASPTASKEAAAVAAVAAPAAVAAAVAVVKKERKPLSDERLAYLKSAEHLAKMKAGKEKKRAATAASAVAPAPENEMVIGESPPSSTVKTYKLKGSSEERTAIIANLPLGRACGKGDAVINWRKGTKHYPLSKWPAAILEQLSLGVCTKEAICTATLLSLKNFDDFVRELKHQNLME